MLWLNFIIALISIFLLLLLLFFGMVMFDKLMNIHYNTQKQKKIKTKPGIKLNLNNYIDTTTGSRVEAQAPLYF